MQFFHILPIKIAKIYPPPPQILAPQIHEIKYYNVIAYLIFIYPVNISATCIDLFNCWGQGYIWLDNHIQPTNEKFNQNANK